MAFILGSSIGQSLGDLSFDGSGSYSPALVGYGVALVAAAFLISSLGPYVHAPQRLVGLELAAQATGGVRSSRSLPSSPIAGGVHGAEASTAWPPSGSGIGSIRPSTTT
jgi:hypothetical protein